MKQSRIFASWMLVLAISMLLVGCSSPAPATPTVCSSTSNNISTNISITDASGSDG